MPSDLTEKLASRIQVHHYGVGQTIFRKGEEADLFYIINTGRVREVLHGEKETTLAVLTGGECPGAVSMLSGERRFADAVVEEDVELYVIYKEDLLRLFSTYPEMNRHFNRILSQKISRFFELFEKEKIEIVREQREDLEKERELALIEKIAALFKTTADMESRLSSVVGLMKESLKTDACSLYIVDTLSDQLILQASSGLELPENKTVALRVNEGVTGWVVKNREPVTLEDAGLDSRIKYLREIHEERFKSLLSVPLISGGECLGAINFQTISPRKYSYEEIRGTAIAGAQIASAYYSSLLEKKVTDELNTLRSEKRALPEDFKGDSPFIRKINRFIETAAQTDRAVLICGEDGTGKELLARLIHSANSRNTGPFIEVDCSFFPADTWGDELFGTEKEGEAFPANKIPGFIEKADKGVLFLKNIDRLNSACQVKLFNFIKSGLFNRVGSLSAHRANVRIIATTWKDLKPLVLNGSFSPNFYSSLGGFVFKTVPLRKMKREIPDLSSYLLKKISRKRRCEGILLSEAAEKKLQSYDWPGNVTELENALNGAAILASGKTIEPEHLFFPSSSPGEKPVYRVFKIRWLNQLFKSRFFPDVLGTSVLFLFALTLFVLFALPQNAWFNSFLWSGGWFFLFLSLFFVGRVFCAVCPFMRVGELARKVMKTTGAKPGPLSRYGEIFAGVFIFAIFYLEGAFGLHEQPVYTGILLLTITAGAVVCSVFFLRRAWCRYLCPLGSLLGLFSLSSLFSLGANRHVCIYRCSDHSCYTGTKQGEPGCQLFLHPYGAETPQHCVLCMQCHKNCPYDSVSLNLQFPASEVASVTQPSFLGALVSAGLLGILPVENGGLLSPAGSYFPKIMEGTGMSFPGTYSTLFLGAALFPAAGMIAVERFFGGHDLKKSIFRFTRFAYALLPMALIGHMALYGKKTVSWGETAFSGTGFNYIDFYSANLVFLALFAVLVVFGVAGTVHSFFRICRKSPSTLYMNKKSRFGYGAFLSVYVLLYFFSILNEGVLL